MSVSTIMKHVTMLALLLLGLHSASHAQLGVETSNIEVLVLSEQPDTNTTYHSLNANKKHYYRDNADTFYLDIQQVLGVDMNAVAIDTLFVGEDPHLIGAATQIAITGLPLGDHTVTLKAVDATNAVLGPSKKPVEYKIKYHQSEPLVTNDAVVLGMLILLLAAIFYTSSSKNPAFQKFYKVIPMLLLCYFLPSLLNTFGIVSGEVSSLYYVSSRYLLPASLVLLTLSIDLKEVFRLGPKALVMFFTATVGVILGGPLAILITATFAPEWVGGAGPEAVWRGMTTVAGSWIGGGANQAAMYEVFDPSDSLYSVMITVDVIVAEVWMFFLLLGVGKSKQLDNWFKADASSITTLQEKMESFSLSIARIFSSTDLMVILGICFGAVGLSHLLADTISPLFKDVEWAERLSLNSGFFWLIVTATTIGLGLSFTKARSYEGAGASKVGTIFIYVLVASIGMKMDIKAIISNPGAFIVGGIWMAFHVGLLFIVGKIIRAPYFFLAVGSKANIGGAASAPVVAAAFHPALAPVGVLLAVLGYALGTYGAWLCGLLMEIAAPTPM